MLCWKYKTVLLPIKRNREGHTGWHDSKIFENNPDLANLFPDETSRSTLKPYFVYRGKGEIFDLSGEERKMQRERFSFGGYSVNLAGCFITEDCTACGICLDACPFGAISEGEPYVIDTRYCDECGVCYSLCPVDAIELPKGM
ncbi:MAG: 4Fe-4S binding protein [Deltaproteobacteria bacterium]|nr:4Fe-4S binding protein [Deltaproteobacteria bacterium]